jgi:hypothetical protein
VSAAAAASALGATLLVLVAGGFPFRGPGAARGWSALPWTWAAGAVTLHVLLAAATLAGIPWGPVTFVGAALVGGAAWAGAARFRIEPLGGARGGAGDLATAGVVALVVVLGAAGRVTQPDFFYHWGLKARRFLEISGADYYFLAGPSAWRLHPDYPLLVPELLMLPGALAGGFAEAAALAVAAVPLVLLPLALRRALDEAGLDGATLGGAVATVTALLAAFVVAYGLVGSADPWIALALALALPALAAGEATPARGWELGIAAALAAAAKIEGVPLAACLIGVELLRRVGRGRWSGIAHLARVALPAAVVCFPWFALARAYGLFLETNAGAPDPGRLPVIARAAAAVAVDPTWALAPLALVALPWLLAARRSRATAAVITFQLVFYFAVYLTGPVDTRFYVLATFPRLLFHLLPATLALLAIAALAPGPSPRGAPPRESPAT